MMSRGLLSSSYAISIDVKYTYFLREIHKARVLPDAHVIRPDGIGQRLNRGLEVVHAAYPQRRSVHTGPTPDADTTAFSLRLREVEVVEVVLVDAVDDVLA